jgi:hypothetical protein
MATFPAYLKLDLDGFKDRPEPIVRRTEMENGLAKQMPRASKRLQPKQLVYWVDSLANYNAFKTWVKDTINNGAGWFDWTEPISGATVSARLRDGAFEGTPVNKALSYWRISMTIEYYA